MRQSKLFTDIAREFPKDEESLNAKLLTRAGFVEKLMAGVYSYLPFGLRVLRNLESVVREEMNAVGGEEILMPMLHPRAIWDKTGGWEKIDVLFKVPSRTEKVYALGQSEEEVVTPLVMKRVQTYRDLPLAVYQIHWKFRDELRAKSGLLRGREFLMKDMYSFHETQEDFERFYDMVKQAYFRVFARLGLTVKATEASGGGFSEKISYEFMVLTDAGEDKILYCDKCEFCVNGEITNQKDGGVCPKCGNGKLSYATASEVGNVFDLGEKYGKDFDLGFVNADGAKKYPIMGCYGLGISRLMGVLVEKNHDDKGIVWPREAAPFLVHLIAIHGKGDAEAKETIKRADAIYHALQKKGIAVLYDDRTSATAGEKFAEADMLGIPIRAVISAKTGEKVEVKRRSGGEVTFVSKDEFFNLLLTT